MRRVSRRSCEDGPLLDDQETEGQRRLHGLLLQQLHTDADIDRCVAKRQCFAPAALYRPFGEQAAGVRSLAEFQALQEGDAELDALRGVGLTDAEVQLWQSRDGVETAGAGRGDGVCPAPGAKQQRLQAITDKMAARAALLSRPQRFAASRPLSRREMEIERSLFQGSDRLGFLAALYHPGEDNQSVQPGDMDSVYRDVLIRDTDQSQPSQTGQSQPSQTDQSQPSPTDQSQPSQTDQSQPSQTGLSQSEDASELHSQTSSSSETRIDIRQPIRSLRGAARTLTVRGDIESVSDEDILKNRDSEELICKIPRFRNYKPGKPSKVLCVKNLSPQASVSQLVSLFSRFQQEAGSPLVYRLLTGRMKGQAFITLPDAETAQNALQLLHGYRLLGMPLVLEFSRQGDRQEDRQEDR